MQGNTRAALKGAIIFAREKNKEIPDVLTMPTIEKIKEANEAIIAAIAAAAYHIEAIE